MEPSALARDRLLISRTLESMRAAALAIVASLALGCTSEEVVVVVDPPAHRPLECTFEIDEAFAALRLPDGRPITQYWEMTSTPRGVLYAPVQMRFGSDGDYARYVTGVARFEGTWSVESVPGEWWQVWDVAASDDDAWMSGELGPFPSRPAIVRRNGGAWKPIDPPDGFGQVYRLFPSAQGLFALGVEPAESASMPLLARHDGVRWTRINVPSDWTDTYPTTVRVIGSTVVVGLVVGRPISTDAKRGLLARVDGDRLIPIDTAIELPPIHAISGTGLDDLLLLAAPGFPDPRAVYWVDSIGGRAKLVHQDRESFADLWSPRPGVALVAPSYYHAGRLTVLDGQNGPHEVELEKPGVLHYIEHFAPEGDGRTVHFLAHENGRRVQHRRGACR